MKLNSGGLKLCAAYLVFVIQIMVWLHFTPEPKAGFWIASLAWLPGGLILANLHPHESMRPLIPVLSFLAVYLIGWGSTSSSASRAD